MLHLISVPGFLLPPKLAQSPITISKLITLIKYHKHNFLNHFKIESVGPKKLTIFQKLSTLIMKNHLNNDFFILNHRTQVQISKFRRTPGGNSYYTKGHKPAENN